MAMTKKEIKAELNAIGVEFSDDLNKEELFALYEAAMEEEGEIVTGFENEFAVDDEISVNEEKPKQKATRENQASLVDCFRQLAGIKKD